MLLLLGLAVLAAGVIVILTLVLNDPARLAAKQEAKETKARQEAALKELHNTIVKPDKKAKKEAGEKKSGGWFSAEKIEIAGLDATPGKYWRNVALAIVGDIFLTAIGLFPVWAGILLIILAPFFPKWRINRALKKKQKEFAGQLGQSLQVISSSLQAGQSLTISLTSVADEAQEPMKSEISRVVNETRLGRDVVESLMDCAKRMNSEDFEWFASAVDLQRRTGGNLVEIIETVAETIRERFELREKIRAYSAEGRLQSYVLMALPIVIGALFQVMNPDYMKPLFSSAIGLALLGVSVVMYFIAYFWMSKIVAVKL